MMKISAIVFCLFAALLQSREALSSEWVVFRNSEYQFRFLFPADWAVNTPKGQNVRASVSARHGPNINCNVVVRASSETRFMSQRELDKELSSGILSVEEWMATLEKFSDVSVLDRRLTKIDNRPAQMATVQLTYEAMGIRIVTRNVQAVTMSPGYLWTITCAAAGETAEAAKKSFEGNARTMFRILSSFVFEP